MGKCKAKVIQTDLCTSRQNQAYPEIIQVYSDIFKTLCDPAYLAPWHIQNPDICRSRSIFRTLAYSQIWYIQNPRIFRTLAYSKFEAEPSQT